MPKMFNRTRHHFRGEICKPNFFRYRNQLLRITRQSFKNFAPIDALHRDILWILRALPRHSHAFLVNRRQAINDFI